MAEAKPFRLAVVNSHVIHNRAPFYQRINAEPGIDLDVYYYSTRGAEEYFDKEFGRRIQWDTPLLDNYRYHVLPNLSSRQGFGFLAFVNPSIVGALRRNRYDAVLVNGHMYLSDWLTMIGALSSRTPILYRGESSLVYDREVKRPWHTALIKRIVLRSLFRWVVSDFLAIGTLNTEFYRHYGVASNRIFFVPYAVDNSFFAQEADRHRERRSDVRTELGLPNEGVVFLFAAKMTAKKAPLELLRAFNCSGPPENASLLMVGAGELLDAAKRYAADHNLQRVVFPGFVNQSELARFYAASDVFVRPDGVYQGDWGLTVNEAMAAGLAIVASDRIGATTDLVVDGENGAVVPFGNIMALADVIEDLSLRPRDVAAMGCRSRERIRTWSYEEGVAGLLQAVHAVTLDRRRY